MSAPPPVDGPLLDAVRWLGVLPHYLDDTGIRRHASLPSLVAVGSALAGLGPVKGADPAAAEDLLGWVAGARQRSAHRVVEPVVVVWSGDPVVVPVRLPEAHAARVVVTVDPTHPARCGETHRVVGGGGAVIDLESLALPVGRHELIVEAPGLPPEGVGCTLVVAPRRLAGIGEVIGRLGGSVGAGGGRRSRPWGVFAPVWSAWETDRSDVHLGMLDEVGAWAAARGASLVGTLPLLATFADRPCDPSPYSPVSRRRWNEALIDVRGAPGYGDDPDARRLAEALTPTDPCAPWDPVGHWASLRPVLGVLAERARAHDGDAAGVLALCERDPELGDYAWFRAEVERTSTSWRNWPAIGRRPSVTPTPNEVRADADLWRWAWAQWVVAEQLAGVAERFAARSQALYLDLALGAHADGFDTWADPDLFGWGASVGAPPDLMFGGGQDWGFPPQRPQAARTSGHHEWARALRTHLAVCGVLRLDHILGLQRLFWVPDGAAPTEGVYVRQPLEELVAVLAVEAHRAGAAVVGEDLGTVDATVRTAMADHGVAGMYIAQFSVPAELTAEPVWPQAGQLAAVNTHDMPTFVGWLGSRDAQHRRDAGLLDDVGVAAVHSARDREVAALRRALGVEEPPVGGGPTRGWEELLAALVVRLGVTEAEAVLVSLDDLAGVAEQQNVPGTPWSRPNWVVRLPRPLSALGTDEQVNRTLAALDAARRGPPGGEGS